MSSEVQPGTHRPYKFVAAGGLVAVISDADVEQTGFKIGSYYRLTAGEAGGVGRWGATEATAADGGFDFALAPNESIVVVATAAALSIKEFSSASASTALLFIQELDMAA